MAKTLEFNDSARRALERGVDALANAVKVTLGPRGRNVVIDKKWGAPTITNDGVTIAKEVELEDPYENLGAQLAKEVATKTNDVAPVGQQSRPAGAKSSNECRTRSSTCRGTGPSDHFSMMASTSRAERIRYSSPEYFTSVPPYLL